MAFSIFFSLCLIVSTTLANPIQICSSPITLAVAVQINSTGGAQALIDRDRARSRALFVSGQAKANGNRSSGIPVPIADAGQVYTAVVGVGADTYTLIVDTGSSNTWVGAGKAYRPGPNSQDTGETVSVSYGSGQHFTGKEFIDDVTIGAATISAQSIGVASFAKGFGGFDGILGLGPDNLTARTTSRDGTLPTVTDNLVSQGTISTALVAVSFVPTTSASNDLHGELNFGATDSSKFTGSISFVNITNTSPANKFWGIDQSVTYGSGVPILSTTAGIVDTGTSLLLLATEAFQAYRQATGATIDNATGLLTVHSPNVLKSLFFHIGSDTFEFTANAQIWPQKLNAHIGGQPNRTYLIVGNLGTPLGRGLDFINGFAFLQRFYSVFDTTNGQVGLATTSYTHDTSN